MRVSSSQPFTLSLCAATLLTLSSLTLTKYGYHPGYYAVYFEGELPEYIQLLAITLADTPSTYRQVRFHDSTIGTSL